MAHWHIQDTHVRFEQLQRTADALDAINVDYHWFGVIPGQPTKIELNTSNVIRGSLKVLTDSFNDASLYRNLFYDIKNFDQHYFMDKIPMINANGEISTYEKTRHRIFSCDMFIKPSSDVKLFAGVIVSAGKTLDDAIPNNGKLKSYGLTNDTSILIAPIRTDLYDEYRFSVLKGEIIHSSKYMTNGKVDYGDNIPDVVLNETQRFVEMYQPHDVFVIDTVKTNNGIEVVELNCWNCSGIYSWNVESMFKKVNDYCDLQV